MPSSSFDNILDKLKTTTRQAADQIQRMAKVSKLKMKGLSLAGEKARCLQTVGKKTYQFIKGNNPVDGNVLVATLEDEITEIEHIESRIRDVENQVEDLINSMREAKVKDITYEYNSGNKPNE